MNYWEDRALSLEESTNAIAKKNSKELQKLVDATYRDIKKDLDAWLYRLAVTVEDKPDNYVNLATELLKKDELDAFHWTLEEYIKRAKSKDDKWLKAVEQASANYHITKLTECKMLLEMQYNELIELQKDKTFKALKEVYNDRYLKTAYDMQRFTGKFSIINPADDYFIKVLMDKSWLPDGKNISSRIWKNKRGTVDKLMEVIHSCGVSGKHPLQYSKEISEALGMCSKRDKYCIDRLLLTESAYVSSVATFENYKDMEVEKYQILATLDSKTSDICRDLDGKIFKIEDYKIGITAPPFHPHCRTTTVPYDEEWEGSERLARDEDGKTYYVPSDMTYPEWKKSFVDGQTEDLKPVVPDDIIRMGTIADESKLGSVHADAMKSILETAPSSTQKVWNKYADRIDVEDAHSKKGAWCNYTKGITLDIDRVSKGERAFSRTTHQWEDAEKPYYTAFHEFGHNISSLMAKDVTGMNYDDIADVFKSKKFTRTVMGKDGAEVVGYTLTQKMKQEGLAYFDSIFDRLKKEAKAKGLSARTVRKQDAWNIIKEEILQHPTMHCTDVSDMWDGISNGSCLAHYGHTNQDKQYWKSISVGTEGFAEMFSATVMNPDSVEQIKHYFPESYEIFLEILEEMGG